MFEKNLLKQFFPAGGVIAKSIKIMDIKPTKQIDVFVGFAQFSLLETAQKVVVYHVVLDNGRDDYRMIPAACPHQGADISRDELKPDGNVYCSLHKRPICVYSKFNQAYPVEKRGELYFVVTQSK